MKKSVVILIGLLLMNYTNALCNYLMTAESSSEKDSITVFSAPGLYSISTKWAAEFNNKNPEARISVVRTKEQNASDEILKSGKLGFTSSVSSTGDYTGLSWQVAVGRNVIVPVYNQANPNAEAISKNGISKESFASYMKNKENGNWGTLLKNSKGEKVHLYTIKDESVSEGFSDYLGIDKSLISGIVVEDAARFVSAIQNDPLAIGLCKITDIVDNNVRAFYGNIKLLPLDKNSNGTIDFNESIYTDFNSFTRGVWIGKYPKSLISNIYSVSDKQPVNPVEIAFMKFVLTDGQEFLGRNGYADLLITERKSYVDKLYQAKIYPGAAKSEASIFKTGLLVLAILVIAVLLFDGIFRLTRKQKAKANVAGSHAGGILNENNVIIPAGIYFDKTHTWAFMEQNGLVKVGIDDFLQHITGTITKMKLLNQGDKVRKGDLLLSIVQNGKQLNLYSPVSGVICDKNSNVVKDTSIVNTSPYNDGWIYRIEPTNWFRETQLLFMAEKQKMFIKNEFLRLKDFLTYTLYSNSVKLAPVVFQDGGELIDGLLSNLGPEEWEDFQTKFIDPSKQIMFYELF